MPLFKFEALQHCGKRLKAKIQKGIRLITNFGKKG